MAQCRVGFQLVDEKRKCRALLVTATNDCIEDQIREGLATATKLQLKNDSTIEAANAMLKRIDTEKSVYMTQLSDSIKSGGWLQINDVISFDSCKRAMESASKFGMKTAAGIKLAREVAVRYGIRVAMKAALASPKERALWNAVDNAIIEAGSDFGDINECNAAKDQVALHAEIEAVVEKLALSSEKRSENEINHWLNQARKLNMDSTPEKLALYPHVTYCEFLLQQLVACREFQEACVNAPVVQLEQLELAVAMADSLSYSTEATESTRDLWLKVCDIDEKAKACVRTLPPDDMKRVVVEGDSLRMKTEEIEHLRTLLYRTPEEKFVQLQLKAAVNNQDPARRIRLTIKLKDIFLKRSGDQFQLNKFDKLRTPKEWAAESFFTWDKDALAQTFWKHTMDSIHATMIDFYRDSREGEEELCEGYEKTAIKLFKNILGFMGDRQLPFPTILCREILEAGMQNPKLRDEIFLQLIKQLTSNPSNDSLVRGWKLLQICLECFPPNTDFENFFETWLRSQVSGAQSMQQSSFAQYQATFVSILHSTVYGGAIKNVPSENDIDAIIAGRINHFPNSAAAALETSQAASVKIKASLSSAAAAAAALSSAELVPSLFDTPMKTDREASVEFLNSVGLFIQPLPELGCSPDEEIARIEEFRHFALYAAEQVAQEKEAALLAKKEKEEKNLRLQSSAVRAPMPSGPNPSLAAKAPMPSGPNPSTVKAPMPSGPNPSSAAKAPMPSGPNPSLAAKAPMPSGPYPSSVSNAPNPVTASITITAPCINFLF